MKRDETDKQCYCKTCDRWFHYLGIARHRASHRRKQEDCVIMYTNGDAYKHEFSKLERQRKITWGNKTEEP